VLSALSVYICGKMFHECFTEIMATFKAVVQKHHKKEDGTYNVKIRVTHRRVVKYMATRLFVTKEDITKSMKIKNQAVLDMLDETVRKYRTACNALGERLDDMTAEQVVEYVKKPEGEPVFRLDFMAFGGEVIESMKKAGRTGSANNYAITLNAVRRFTGRETLDISEVTVTFLEDFTAWIGDNPFNTNRERGGRAQSLYTSNIRALHNMAKKKYNRESEGVIRIPRSPFSEFKVPKEPLTRKRALPVVTIQAIAALPYMPDPGWRKNRYNLAKDMFLLSFGLVGMNSADLYNCDCIKDFREGRITYRRAKVAGRRTDGAEISIRIEPEMQPLIEKYKDPAGERVFRFYRMYSDAQSFNHAINKGLKKIGAESSVDVDDLEYYAARHSWATVAVNVAKIDRYTVHEALNHATKEMKVTNIYIKPDWSLIDEANRKVLDCVNLKL
jgi:integrase